MQARKKIAPVFNPYWNGISAFVDRIEYQDFRNESIMRCGVMQTIIMEENRLFASREQENIEKITEEAAAQLGLHSIAVDLMISRKWTDFFSGSIFLLLPEVALKVIGALFVDMNVAAKKKATDQDTSLLWYAPWALTSLANAFVAQPLFFVANILLHTRTVIDGTATFVKGLFTLDPATMWRGVKGFARGVACLASDALAIGIAIGAAILCSLIFQPHLAAGIMPALVGAQSAIMGAVSTPALAAVATTTGVTAALSTDVNLAVTHKTISSTKRCANLFSTQPELKKLHYRPEPMVITKIKNSICHESSVLTTPFGFYPPNQSETIHVPENGLRKTITNSRRT